MLKGWTNSILLLTDDQWFFAIISDLILYQSLSESFFGWPKLPAEWLVSSFLILASLRLFDTQGKKPLKLLSRCFTVSLSTSSKMTCCFWDRWKRKKLSADKFFGFCVCFRGKGVRRFKQTSKGPACLKLMLAFAVCLDDLQPLSSAALQPGEAPSWFGSTVCASREKA